VETEHIIQINENLTHFQRITLDNTPFKWVVNLKKNLQIFGNVLRELVS